jgi:integrase
MALHLGKRVVHRGTPRPNLFPVLDRKGGKQKEGPLGLQYCYVEVETIWVDGEAQQDKDRKTFWSRTVSDACDRADNWRGDDNIHSLEDWRLKEFTLKLIADCKAAGSPSATTLKKHRQNLDNHLLRLLKNPLLQDIDAAMVADMLDDLANKLNDPNKGRPKGKRKGQGYSPNMVLSIYGTLRWILEEACSSQYKKRTGLKGNVARQVNRRHKPKVKNSRAITQAQVFTSAELKLVIQRAYLGDNEIRGVFCQTGRLSGLRIAEISAQIWPDYDFKMNRYRVHRQWKQDPDTGVYDFAPLKHATEDDTKERWLELTPAHRALMIRYREWLFGQKLYDKDGFVFPGQPGKVPTTEVPVSPHAFSNTFARLCDELGLTRKELTFHSFRHTFATEIYAARGRECLDLLGFHLGHSSSKITEETYVHWKPRAEDLADWRSILPAPVTF